MDRYSEEMASLTRRLLGFLAADLGVAAEALLGAFAGKRQTAGVHRYPPRRLTCNPGVSSAGSSSVRPNPSVCGAMPSTCSGRRHGG